MLGRFCSCDRTVCSTITNLCCRVVYACSTHYLSGLTAHQVIEAASSNKAVALRLDVGTPDAQMFASICMVDLLRSGFVHRLDQLRLSAAFRALLCSQ